MALTPLPAPRKVGETCTTPDGTSFTCTDNTFALCGSTIHSGNLLDYLNRPDVLYIDTRDYGEYIKKHLRNFEVIPFYGLIFEAEAENTPGKHRLFGGTVATPIPLHPHSDELLSRLLPRDRTLFLMCNSGGRVAQLMTLLQARGYDMGRIYNIGGITQYTGDAYAHLYVDGSGLALSSTGDVVLEG